MLSPIGSKWSTIRLQIAMNCRPSLWTNEFDSSMIIFNWQGRIDNHKPFCNRRCSPGTEPHLNPSWTFTESDLQARRFLFACTWQGWGGGRYWNLVTTIVIRNQPIKILERHHQCININIMQRKTSMMIHWYRWNQVLRIKKKAMQTYLKFRDKWVTIVRFWTYDFIYHTMHRSTILSPITSDVCFLSGWVNSVKLRGCYNALDS